MAQAVAKGPERLTAEVAVVGGGPAGLTAAIALASAGIETALIARKPAADHRDLDAMRFTVHPQKSPAVRTWPAAQVG